MKRKDSALERRDGILSTSAYCAGGIGRRHWSYCWNWLYYDCIAAQSMEQSNSARGDKYTTWMVWNTMVIRGVFEETFSTARLGLLVITCRIYQGGRNKHEEESDTLDEEQNRILGSEGLAMAQEVCTREKRKVVEAAAMALRTSTTLGQNSFSCALFWLRTRHRLHVSDWTMLPSELLAKYATYWFSKDHCNVAPYEKIANSKCSSVLVFHFPIWSIFQWTHRSLGGKGLLFVSWCIDKRVAVRLTAPEAVAQVWASSIQGSRLRIQYEKIRGNSLIGKWKAHKFANR